MDEAQEKINKEFFKIVLQEYKNLRLRICGENNPEKTAEFKLKKNDDMYIEDNKESINKIERFISSFNKLDKLQRTILYLSYLDEQYNDTGFIANSLGYSKGYFHKLKRNTINSFLVSYGLVTIL